MSGNNKETRRRRRMLGSIKFKQIRTFAYQLISFKLVRTQLNIRTNGKYKATRKRGRLL